MSKNKFPQFSSYACEGDFISWQKDGFNIKATLCADTDAHVNDSDCYSFMKIKQWKNDDWFFVGVVLSVSKNDIEILDHAASIWGIECNFNKKSNRYLSDVAREMESEALESAKVQAEKIIFALLN